MATIIKKGHLTVHVKDELDRYSDGTIYRVMETGYESTSQKLAINNAFAYLRKQWRRYIRKINRFRSEIEIETPSKEKVKRIRTKSPVKRKRTQVEYLVEQSISAKNRIVLTPEMEQQMEDDDTLLRKLLKKRKLKPLKRRRLKKAKPKVTEEEVVMNLIEKRTAEREQRKLKELKKKVKQPRRRRIFTVQDDEQLDLDKLSLAKLEQQFAHIPVVRKRRNY